MMSSDASDSRAPVVQQVIRINVSIMPLSP